MATDRAHSTDWTAILVAIGAYALIGGVLAYFLPWILFYLPYGLTDTSGGPTTSTDPHLAPLGAIVGAIVGGFAVRQQRGGHGGPAAEVVRPTSSDPTNNLGPTGSVWAISGR